MVDCTSNSKRAFEMCDTHANAPADPSSRNRVFVSYSHKDSQLVRVIVNYLELVCDLNVIWDERFESGQGFHDQIRDCIGHAHAFLPVLTQDSSRGWVQQEIGFAMAMNIPVIPIAIGELPGQMISLVHAVKLDSLNSEDSAAVQTAAGESVIDAIKVLRQADADPVARKGAHDFLAGTPLWVRLLEKLPTDRILRLIHRHADTSMARYQCADYQEERTILMVRHANTAFDLCHKGQQVLQLGGLSSFHIPMEDPSNEIWNARYGRRQRGEYHKKLQWMEREALCQHITEAGCKLIVNPYHRYQDSGPRAYAIRLLCLRRFLIDGLPGNATIEIAINHRLGFHDSLTIVGDYFAAVAVAGSSAGYMQTVFTTHAPSMRSRQDQFHRFFNEAIDDWKWTDTRQGAITEIERILKKYLKVEVPAHSSAIRLSDLKHLDDRYDGWDMDAWRPSPPFLETDQESDPPGKPIRKSKER